MANVGLGQEREEGVVEPPLLTSGDDLVTMGRFLGERQSYGAEDVITYLLGGPATPHVKQIGARM